MHFSEPVFDRSVEDLVDRYTGRPLGLHRGHAAMGHDELCACCHGGTLLPAACLPRSA